MGDAALAKLPPLLLAARKTLLTLPNRNLAECHDISKYSKGRTMTTENRDPLTNAFAALETCQLSLKKLGDTCCRSERSSKMIILVDEVTALRTALEEIGPDSNFQPEAVFETIEKVGTALGALYATCCTPTRERLYTEMFRALGIVYRDTWRLNSARK